MDEAVDVEAARRAFEQAIGDHAPAFERFFLARMLGLTFNYTDTSCEIRFPVYDFLYNPQGSLHGGIIALVLDVSMGHLLNKVTGGPGTTMEMKTQYFAPVRTSSARAVSGFLHRGRRVAYMEAKLFDANGTLAAAATSTWMILKPPAESLPAGG
jgi:uncharacterized protein (TIGR00369 family)